MYCLRLLSHYSRWVKRERDHKWNKSLKSGILDIRRNRVAGVGSTEKVGVWARWVFKGVSLQAWKQPQERPSWGARLADVEGSEGGSIQVVGWGRSWAGECVAVRSWALPVNQEVRGSAQRSDWIWKWEESELWVGGSQSKAGWWWPGPSNDPPLSQHLADPHRQWWVPRGRVSWSLSADRKWVPIKITLLSIWIVKFFVLVLWKMPLVIWQDCIESVDCIW